MNSNNLSTSTNPLPESWVERMFDRMLLDFGKKFTDQWQGADPDKLVKHWAHEMAQYSAQEIKRGLDAMQGRDWPPTLPEFKKMCRPATDRMVAYYEAVAGVQARDRGEAGEWSHPAIYWAAARMSFDLKNQTYSQIKYQWEIALDKEMDKGEWESIPQPMLALPDIGKSALSKESAAKMIEQLGATATVKNAEEKTDHKRWAKRIMERQKRGDKALSVLQINFAREAVAASEVH